MGRPKKKGAQPSKLSKRAREIIARTKKARAAIDAELKGFVNDDPTPVMVSVGPPRGKDEQPEESPEMAIAAAERKKRARKTAKAREKRLENAKARRAQEQALDQGLAPVAADDMMSAG